eukprot:TRINITY_DN3053_c0_g2_i1.p1 TRINITY_DN3053_c0_g2~~TRINITY_DN3053_c0_g2_i1.p1  ORF type:complete len:170 (+),score=9.86 TRINITY_DN3053_c0_g2_i1:231-740(+)
MFMVCTGILGCFTSGLCLNIFWDGNFFYYFYSVAVFNINIYPVLMNSTIIMIVVCSCCSFVSFLIQYFLTSKQLPPREGYDELYGFLDEDPKKAQKEQLVSDVDTLCDTTIEPKEMKCIVCLVNVRTCLYQPCGHLCLCGQCSIKLLETDARCPICRGNIEYTQGVYHV